MLAALLCASLAARGAALVPARAEAAVLFDGAGGIAGLHQFLETAGTKSRALAPYELSRESIALFGPDLLSGAPGWGLDPRGARALVFAGNAYALSAPVRDGKAARKALIAWVGAAGPWSKRTGRRNPISAGSGRSQRAGIVAPQEGSVRLLTASGRGAEMLVAALWRIGAQRSPTRTLAHDRRLEPLLPAGNGKAALIVRGDDPITFAVLELSADASSVVARGLVGAPSPLLAGHAPDASACTESSLFCLRASLGLSGKAALALASQMYLSGTSPAGPLADLLHRRSRRSHATRSATRPRGRRRPPQAMPPGGGPDPADGEPLRGPSHRAARRRRARAASHGRSGRNRRRAFPAERVRCAPRIGPRHPGRSAPPRRRLLARLGTLYPLR
ncbi:MAG: hypothetical protein E6J62_18725 [Deltaproteobacteria bacterium]|nr:MAG: hypothetical protein E6J62_18725 [Deltaproteobacteria bacterium]